MALRGVGAKAGAINAIIGYAGNLGVGAAASAGLGQGDGGSRLDERAVVNGLYALACGGYAVDATLVVEGQLIHTHLTVHTGTVVEVALVDAVVHDVPIVGAGHVDH